MPWWKALISCSTNLAFILKLGKYCLFLFHIWLGDANCLHPGKMVAETLVGPSDDINTDRLTLDVIGVEDHGSYFCDTTYAIF